MASKTTKTWIWTSNTVDVDYGVPTRHRRETEDTLSPVSTKSTGGLSTTKEMLKRKEISATPATNHVTMISDATLDASVARSSRPWNSTEEEFNNGQETQADAISAAVASTAESKSNENEADAEYPSAINQGQLFSIIENGEYRRVLLFYKINC